ncbi:MAG: hypothetical protein KDA91_09995 [Planctomycetaceae bacterium]|nr:hypothetical protein [Planctomycetaceae bacterium]
MSFRRCVVLFLMFAVTGWNLSGRALQTQATASEKKTPATVEDTFPVRSVQEIEGWKVHVHPILLSRYSGETSKAMQLLKLQLVEIRKNVPKKAVESLTSVPLYFSPTYEDGKAGAAFHPNRQWLIDNGRDPQMAKAVEFTNILIFEQELVRMPNFALHELAHAYHNLFLPKGFNNPEVMKAYDRAKNSGSYDSVERFHGVGGRRTFERAYGMNNPMEYFAEATEAYFSRNDFFPFDKQQLKVHDPAMFELLGQLWQMRQ